MLRRTIHIAPRVFMNFRRPCQLRFDELLCSAQMGRAIRMELLAARKADSPVALPTVSIS